MFGEVLGNKICNERSLFVFFYVNNNFALKAN